MHKVNASTRLFADWWSRLSKARQDAYIKKHPRSKKAREADKEKPDVADKPAAAPEVEDKPVADKAKPGAETTKPKAKRAKKPAAVKPPAVVKQKHVTGPAAHKAVKHDLDAMETMGLKTYSADAGRAVPYYKEINNDLRSGKELSPTAANITRNLDHTFSTAKTTEPIEVYRGLDGKFAASLTKGSTFVDPGFSSTTSSEDVAKKFAGGDGAVLMKISVPKGSKAVSIDSTTSDYPEEQEILLNRGGTYKITDVTVENGIKTIHVEYNS